ncbi:MAG: inner membrane CreD family protein [Limisphaerales bacterium]
MLAAIYGFLYIALQLQDYSLLFGTAGLFAALAIVLYATRNIDWYQRDRV